MADPNLVSALHQVVQRQPGVRLALLFGSAAKGSLGPESDVDLALLCQRPLTAEQRMKVVGDVAECTGRAVDLVDLATVGEPLLGQILTHGQRLCGSDSEHAALIHRHWLDAADFLPYAQRIVDSRRAAWTGR